MEGGTDSGPQGLGDWYSVQGTNCYRPVRGVAWALPASALSAPASVCVCVCVCVSIIYVWPLLGGSVEAVAGGGGGGGGGERGRGARTGAPREGGSSGPHTHTTLRWLPSYVRYYSCMHTS